MQMSFKLLSVVAIGMALLVVPSSRAEVLYLANTDGNSIAAYSIDGNGALKQVTGSPFPSGIWPVSVKADPFGRFLYVSNMGDGTIWTYRVNSNGALTRLAVSKAGSMPQSLAVDPFGRFLYVTNLDGEGIPEYGGTVGHVSAYRISGNGTLTPVPGSPFPAGYSPLCVEADPTGRFIYVGNAGSQTESTETISGYRVNGNGALVPLPGSPFPDGESPQSMAADPFGRFLYTAGAYDLALLTYHIAWTGNLTNMPGSSFSIDGGFQPWNAVVADPFGRFVFTSSGDLINPANATLTAYRTGANGLTFGSSYPAGFVADSMVVDHSGQYLYAAVSVVKGARGPVDGTGVAAYRINGNGAVTPVTGSPFLVGFSPDSMTISRQNRLFFDPIYPFKR
jgi:6-phosphogluconolactonase